MTRVMTLLLVLFSTAAYAQDWNELNEAQRSVLGPYEGRWKSFSEEEQASIAAGANRWANMAAGSRAQIQQRFDTWQALPEGRKRDLMNHFNIRKGEKLMNIEFGTIIWDVLFEPLTEDLRDAIVEDVTEIANYDPRIITESVLVDEYENGILVEVSIRYKNTSEVESMRFMFDQNQASVAI